MKPTRQQKRLFKACHEGDIKTVQQLLAFGVMPNVLNSEKQTCIDVAASGGFIDIVKLLYSYFVKYKLRNPFFSSILRDDEFVIKTLIDSDIPFPYMSDCLKFYKNSEFRKIITKLKELGVFIAVDSGVNYAIEHHCNNEAKYLMELDPNINFLGPYFRKPIYRAITCNNIKIFTFLINMGLHHTFHNLLIRSLQYERFSMAQILIKKGIGISEKYEYHNHYDDYFYTYPILYAAEGGYLEIVKLLVEKGVDINVVNSKGYNLLHFAVMSENIELIEYVLELGIDIHSSNPDGRTTLNLACYFFKVDPKIVELLLSRM